MVDRKVESQAIPKVYFFGLSHGKTIKIGFTKDPLWVRKKTLLSGQMTNVDLHLLAAVRGTGTHESEVKKHFKHLKDEANSTETFYAEPELVEYINWLRQQWWVYLEEDDCVDEIPSWPSWMPTNDRRVGFIEEDPYDLIPRNLAYFGPLAQTPWNKLSTPQPKVGDDFYTPPEYVNAARQAMGGIDLDAASHWQANRVHHIPDYFHLARRAEDNKWYGRVWLNPPYPGKGARGNDKWFDLIKKYWDSRDIEQLCMLSPMWAFNTDIAKPVMDRSSAMVILTPTPEFWGNPKGRTGTNHPHAIIYLGDRVQEFRNAFVDFGIPAKLIWE